MQDLKTTNQKLVEILSKEKGYFGRIRTWGQGLTEYEYIGYELTEDFLPTLQELSVEQQRTLIKIMYYFEIHTSQLKKILTSTQENMLDDVFSKISWSQFMTVVMFGMLELAVKKENDSRLNNKGEKIKKFLLENLPEETKESLTKRYKVEKIFKYEREIKNFSDIIDHLWFQIRSGFIHDGGIESKGLEWQTLEGIGTEENPITFKSDVPMQEWLQITWQAILNSYGYRGKLELPKHKKDTESVI